MKALVTGDRGFVGRHYVNFLKDKGWDVWGIDLLDGFDALEFFQRPDDDTHYDLVVHCAYEVGGRAHIDGKNMALAHNVALDAAMFDWALKTYQGAVLYFSSCAAYPAICQDEFWAAHGSLQCEDIIELDSTDDAPLDNYGWAKLTGERIAKQAEASGLRTHVVRPYSGYGADQANTYPFPSIIKRAQRGDYTVWGPPGQTRDWIHISDVVAGSFAVYQNDERDPVNLCTGIGTEMGELMKLAANDGMIDIIYDQDKPYGSLWRVGDPTRFSQHYTPQISIEEGVYLATSS